MVQQGFLHIHLIRMALILASFSVLGQTQGSKNVSVTIPAVALVDIEPSNSAISFSFSAPSEAGNPVSITNNTDKWLNYTSTVAIGDSDRTISANISSTVSGIDILVEAGSATGGEGVLGTPSGQITLTAIGTMFISGIRGAATGNGASNGHQLTYTLQINDYGALTQLTNETVTVTYTISN